MFARALAALDKAKNSDDPPQDPVLFLKQRMELEQKLEMKRGQKYTAAVEEELQVLFWGQPKSLPCFSHLTYRLRFPHSPSSSYGTTTGLIRNFHSPAGEEQRNQRRAR